MLFRSKDKGKARAKDVKPPPVERQRPAAVTLDAKKSKETKSTGITLVKATPVKPKVNIGRTRNQRFMSTLPITEPRMTPSSSNVQTMRQASGRDILQMELEGDAGGDEEDGNAVWNLPSSPDVLLLGSQGRNMRGRSSLTGHTLVEDTPTKPHKH